MGMKAATVRKTHVVLSKPILELPTTVEFACFFIAQYSVLRIQDD